MAQLSVDAAEDLLHTRFAPWVLDLDLSVAATAPDGVTLRMRANRSHPIPGTEIVSGQALMALADTAMVIAFACMAAKFVPVATIDQTTSFMRPAKGGEVLAQAEVVRSGRALGFAHCRLTTAADGQLVATAVGTYAMPPT